MPRQVLPLINFRTQAQRQGITKNMQTVRAIVGILQTVGAAEQKRREEQTLTKITRAMSGGATVIEAIAASKGPEFSTGVPGALQKIGGMFQPSPGGMDKSIQQAIIGRAIQRDPLETEARRADIDLTKARTKYYSKDRTKAHGVAPWYMSPEWANTPEGIKAREKAFEGMTKEERIKTLQSGLNAAAGQYFYQEGLEGGATQPKNPVLYDFYADLLREEGIPVKERPGSQKKTGDLPEAGPEAGPKVGPGKYKFTATNPTTGEKMGSNDGVKWEPIR